MHVDTLQFYRPDRLPQCSVAARQWRWKVVKGWAWKFEQHINVLEMEALYGTLKWRAKSLQNYAARFLHLTDSQVVLGIVSKGRTNSKRLRRTLGWVASEENPADEPSRWFVLL